MTTPTSLQLRPIVAELNAAFEESGKALLDAEQTHRLATRRDLLNGTYSGSDQTAAAVETARKAQEQARIARDEAAGLLADAVARERAAEEAATRDELRGMVERLATTAAEADAALALFVAKARAAMEAEAEARRVCEAGLARSAHGITGIVPAAIGDAIVFLQALRYGNPADFASFVSDRAALGAKRIAAAAEI